MISVASVIQVVVNIVWLDPKQLGEELKVSWLSAERHS